MVILRQGAVYQPAVKEAETFIFMADPGGGADKAGGHAIENLALRMRVDGEVIMFVAQAPKKPRCPRLARLDEILLNDPVEVRIIFKQVSRAGPPHQRVNRRIRKICAQFVNERRRKQRIAVARHGDDQNFHGAGLLSEL